MLSNNFKSIDQRRLIELIGLIVLLLAFPLLLFVIKFSQDTRSSAAAPDKLETEAGILTSTGVTKQNDSGASGGQYVVFNQGSGPTTTPAPTSPPNLSNRIYGSGFASDSKSDRTIAPGANAEKGSIRYRVSKTGTIDRLTLQFRVGGSSGYSGGNLGRLRLSFHPDDGSSSHRPNENITLGGIPDIDVDVVTGLSHGDDRERPVELTLTNRVNVTAGQIIHIVVENTDSNPNTNYVTPYNFMYLFNAGSPRQPKWNNVDMAFLGYGGSQYPDSWTEDSRHTPNFDIRYTDGTYDGQPYMRVSSRDGADRWGDIGGSMRTRARFPVSSSISVDQMCMRVGRVSGTSPLRLELKNGSGSVLATGEVAGSGSWPATTPTTDSSAGNWGCVSFTKQTLPSGNYSLEASSNSTYFARLVGTTSSNGGFKTPKFPDVAEDGSNGNWSLIESAWNKYDSLQFYLNIAD